MVHLFDLMADPGERKNLWNDPALAGVKSALKDRMLTWHIDSAFHTRDARRRIVSSPGDKPWQ
ncbi:hypothetical protein [Frigidibacter sp. ROC022]|uniref:hypothetical protein n=1 Tax=Frigidibacter sp. ROC022 TaxID=2971796 RepID=UPI00215B07F3|nr:hypothetical protein [Frigidibacter sp. ROC022]MCR8725110.1 hypothetical protein [Frigidibacter sp. ROC022]